MNIAVRISIMLMLFVAIVISLTGCGDPVPMNSFTERVYNECLVKGWVPTYFSNGIKTQVDCQPNRDPIPMNVDSGDTMKACVAAGKNAIYDAKTARVICINEGANLEL